MSSPYREKILEEIQMVPEVQLPKLYKIVHLLIRELLPSTNRARKRGLLRGIWKGAQIDESLFVQAKQSLFPYEY